VRAAKSDGRARAARACADGVPARYRTLYSNALGGNVTPRTAIKLKCLECCAWVRFDDGHDRIRECAILSCPLWALRPFQNAPESTEVPDRGTLLLERATASPGDTRAAEAQQ